MKVPFRRTSPAPQSGPVQAADGRSGATAGPDGTAADQPTAVMAVAQPAPEPPGDPIAVAPATAPATEQLDPPSPLQPPPRAGFMARGRLRRRLLYLRRARELGMRDLGGLVFELHRFGRRNDAVVSAKLDALGAIDGELRGLERLLGERRDSTELHEAGVASCERCGALCGSDARFCPACGTPLGSGLAPARPEAPSQQPAPVAPPVPAPAPVPQSGPAAPLWHTPVAAGGAEDESAPQPPPVVPDGSHDDTPTPVHEPVADGDGQAGRDPAGT